MEQEIKMEAVPESNGATAEIGFKIGNRCSIISPGYIYKEGKIDRQIDGLFFILVVAFFRPTGKISFPAFRRLLLFCDIKKSFPSI